MTMLSHAALPRRERQGHLLFSAVLPFFLAAETLSRAFASKETDDESPRTKRRSLLAEARENASIATSYLLMARSMLH